MYKKRNATRFIIAVTTKQSVAWEDRVFCGFLETSDVNFMIFKKFPKLIGLLPKANDIEL